MQLLTNDIPDDVVEAAAEAPWDRSNDSRREIVQTILAAALPLLALDRDTIARAIEESIPEDIPGWRFRYSERAADAVIAASPLRSVAEAQAEALEDLAEAIVGAPRHRTEHIGRAVSAEQTVYILHSHECRDSGIDLRECPYSVALDRGIDPSEWVHDVPTRLAIRNGRLMDASQAALREALREGGQP